MSNLCFAHDSLAAPSAGGENKIDKSLEVFITNRVVSSSPGRTSSFSRQSDDSTLDLRLLLPVDSPDYVIG